MKSAIVIFIFLLFITCKQENYGLGSAKKLYSKLKNENFEQFLNIEFGTRGTVELWTYYLKSVMIRPFCGLMI